MKPVLWRGDSKKRLRNFPRDSRHAAGIELRRVQSGLDPTDWKPITTVGMGVREIRIHTSGAYRVLYVAKFAGAVYVLHAFQKTSPKTDKRDIDLAAQRYHMLADELKKR